MKIKILLILLVIVSVIACKKDSLGTVPKIKVTSLNTTQVPANGDFRVLLEFADKEGDVSNSIFVQKVRLNKKVVPVVTDTFSLPLPSFPPSSRGEITLSFTYQQIVAAQTPPTIPGSNPPRKESDTLILRLALRDKESHVSDTVSTPQFEVIRN